MTTVDTTTLPPVEPAVRPNPLMALPAVVRVVIYAATFVFLLSLTVEISDQRALTATNTWTSALQLSIPIALAGLGGIWAERTGVINIGLEGMMALGTWFGAWGCIEYGAWAGLAIGVLGGAMGGLLHGVATISFGVDHIISGVAINILGGGVTRFLNSEVYSSTNDSPPIPEQLPEIQIEGVSDLARWMADQDRFFISDLGRMVEGLTTDLSMVVVIGALMFPLTAFILWRTKIGLRLRSAGEDPIAAESLGVNVYLMKYIGTTVSGALAGLGGVALVYVFAERFQVGQTGGRGYIGLAAMIFGNWYPLGTALGAGLFGLTDSMQLQTGSAAHALLLFVGLGSVLAIAWALYTRRWRTAVTVLVAGALAMLWFSATDELPDEIVVFLPHLTTLIVLTFASQRLRPPAHEGEAYRRGQGR